MSDCKHCGGLGWVPYIGDEGQMAKRCSECKNRSAPHGDGPQERTDDLLGQALYAKAEIERLKEENAFMSARIERLVKAIHRAEGRVTAVRPLGQEVGGE